MKVKSVILHMMSIFIIIVYLCHKRYDVPDVLVNMSLHVLYIITYCELLKLIALISALVLLPIWYVMLQFNLISILILKNVVNTCTILHALSC